MMSRLSGPFLIHSKKSPWRVYRFSRTVTENIDSSCAVFYNAEWGGALLVGVLVLPDRDWRCATLTLLKLRKNPVICLNAALTGGFFCNFIPDSISGEHSVAVPYNKIRKCYACILLVGLCFCMLLHRRILPCNEGCMMNNFLSFLFPVILRWLAPFWACR